MGEVIFWLFIGLGISYLIGHIAYWETHRTIKCSPKISALTAIGMEMPLINLIGLCIYLPLCAKNPVWRRKADIRLAAAVVGVLGLLLCFFRMYQSLDDIKNWFSPVETTSVEEVHDVELYGLGGAYSVDTKWREIKHTCVPAVAFLAMYNLAFLMLAAGLGVGSSIMRDSVSPFEGPVVPK
jgi:hypothetical protein